MTPVSSPASPAAAFPPPVTKPVEVAPRGKSTNPTNTRAAAAKGAAANPNAFPDHIDHQRRVRSFQAVINNSLDEATSRQWLIKTLEHEVHALKKHFGFTDDNSTSPNLVTLESIEELNRRFEALVIPAEAQFHEKHRELHLEYALRLRQAWTGMIILMLNLKGDRKISNRDIIDLLSNQMQNNNQAKVVTTLKYLQAKNQITGVINLGVGRSISGSTGITIIVIPDLDSRFVTIKLPRASADPNFQPDLNVDDLHQTVAGLTARDLRHTVANFVNQRRQAPVTRKELEETRTQIKQLETGLRPLNGFYMTASKYGAQAIGLMEQDPDLKRRVELQQVLKSYFMNKRNFHALENNIYAAAFDLCSKLPAHEGVMQLYNIHKQIIELKISCYQRTLASPELPISSSLQTRFKSSCADAKAETLEHDIWTILNKHYDKDRLDALLAQAQDVLQYTLETLAKGGFA